MASLTVAGTVHVPGDKSISHRALILAALAEGESVIREVLVAEDTASTAYALRAMGNNAPPLGPEIRVRGMGLRGLRAPDSAIDCGNSGTTVRLLAGVVAGHPFSATFKGDQSLSRRPMRRIAEPLSAMGARVTLEGGNGLPMIVHGGELRHVAWTSDVASAQVKSAILLAGLVSGVPVSVREPGRSRDHTERMLRSLGAAVTSSRDGVTRLEPVDTLAPFDFVVPRDPSSAAYFIALAALAGAGTLSLPGVCVDGLRTGFIRAIKRMGATVGIGDTGEVAGEERGTITASPGRLRAMRVEESEIPAMIDELPLLACVAARAEGETVVRGAGELRVKESDRIASIVDNLRALGASAEAFADGFAVRGSDKPLRGTVRTHGDHRIAMSFGVLACVPGNDITIDDRDCVAVSYPGFWDDLKKAVA
ncbi:MAG TPA: 3-phosphoshikimate 1-carboxyvinyltransferase [Gemmatimonadaceae bacterium]|nr:3-phosphoshikimate 1-carboxyvinyltransferase [Gemmatimonadaceae bacterium]